MFLIKKKIWEIIKPLYENGCFTKNEYLKICSSGSKLGIQYGQTKSNKSVDDNFPFCGSIFSGIVMPT